MIKNDDKEIWDALFKNKKSGQDKVISESAGCPSLERLINSEDNEDGMDDDFFAWHDRKKEFLGKRGDIVIDSVTGDRGAIVNVRDYEVDLWSPDRMWVAKIKDLVSEEDAEEVDHLAEAIKDMMKTFLDSDEFEGGLQDAFDITIEQIGDSLGYYNLENIGFTEEDADRS